MSYADTAALADLAAKATPGPWQDIPVYESEGSFVVRWHEVHGPDDRLLPDGEADAALIVAAVNALPDLLSEIEALRKVHDAAGHLSAILDNPLTPRSRSAVARAELRAALRRPVTARHVSVGGDHE